MLNINLPVNALDAPDRTLLETVFQVGFEIREIVTTDPHGQNAQPAHPAQRSIMEFLLWFAQPHIQAANAALMAIYDHVDLLSARAQNLRARAILDKTLRVVDAITPDLSALPADPEQAAEAVRNTQVLARESRLIASRLTPASAPRPPKPPAQSKSKSKSQRETEPDSDQLDLSAPTTPAASPAALTHALISTDSAVTIPAAPPYDSIDCLLSAPAVIPNPNSKTCSQPASHPPTRSTLHLASASGTAATCTNYLQ